MLELPPEERKRGAQLCHRYLTLAAACTLVVGEGPVSERRRAELLEDLERLREEAEADLRTYEAEVGIPEMPALRA